MAGRKPMPTLNDKGYETPAAYYRKHIETSNYYMILR